MLAFTGFGIKEREAFAVQNQQMVVNGRFTDIVAIIAGQRVIA